MVAVDRCGGLLLSSTNLFHSNFEFLSFSDAQQLDFFNDFLITKTKAQVVHSVEHLLCRLPT